MNNLRDISHEYCINRIACWDTPSIFIFIFSPILTYTLFLFRCGSVTMGRIPAAYESHLTVSMCLCVCVRECVYSFCYYVHLVVYLRTILYAMTQTTWYEGNIADLNSLRECFFATSRQPTLSLYTFVLLFKFRFICIMLRPACKCYTQCIPSCSVLSVR